MDVRLLVKSMKHIVAALLLAGVLTLPLPAAPVSYRIDFTGGSAMGSLPPTGFFDYDAGGQFSNFLVQWNGATLDLTSAANVPSLAASPGTGCDSAAPDAAYGFLMMSQTAANCTMPAQYAWSGLFFAGAAVQFSFVLNVTNGPSISQDVIGGMTTLNVPMSPMMDMGSGGWSVSQVTSVPEPSSLAMGAIALFAVLGLRARCRRPRSPWSL
jgi:hypothetical protein